MQRMTRASDLTAPELSLLREIVARSFTSRGTTAPALRLRLAELGLVKDILGGVIATPAGRIVARM